MEFLTIKNFPQLHLRDGSKKHGEKKDKKKEKEKKKATLLKTAQ